MEVILLERIEKLGQMGDVVTVKDGYARNYLLPQSKALRANAANRTRFESQRNEIEANNLEARIEAESVAKKLEGKSVVLLRQAGETGQLYGSVTTRDIAEAFAEKGVSFDRDQVDLGRPIKEIGTHKIAVKLHPEVEVTIVANVARSNEEAELQDQGPAIPEAEKIFETAELAEEAEKVLSDEPDTQDEAATEAAPDNEAPDAETAPEAAQAGAAVEEVTESKPKKKTKKLKKAKAPEEDAEAPADKTDQTAKAAKGEEAAEPGKDAD